MAGTIEDRFKEVVLLRRCGKLEEAKASCESILRDDPLHSGALQLVGRLAYEVMKRYPSAVPLKNVGYGNAGELRLYKDQGKNLQALGEIDRSIEAFNRAISVDQNCAEAYFYRGNLQQKLGLHEEAIESYGYVIKLSGGTANTFNNLANSLLALRNYRAALEHYDAAIKICGSHSEAYCNRGTVLESLGEIDAALKSYENSIRINPSHAMSHYNKGNLLEEMKRLDKSIESMSLAFAINPDMPLLKGALLHAKMLGCEWSGLDELYLSIRNSICTGGGL